MATQTAPVRLHVVPTPQIQFHLSTRLGAAKERLQFFGIFKSGWAAFPTRYRLAPGALRISCFRLSVGDGCAYEINVAVCICVLCFVPNTLIKAKALNSAKSSSPISDRPSSFVTTSLSGEI